MKKNNHKDNKSASYESLSKEYSDEELSESFVFPSQLEGDEKKAAHAKFLKMRMELLKNMTPEEIMFGELIRMKLLQSDYFKTDSYDPGLSFTAQLKEYMRITRKSQSELCSDIGIEKTKLSKLVNGKLKPNVELMFRLEKHSQNTIPALNWYKTYLKDLEKELNDNIELKQAQYRFVKSSIDLGKAG